jgi:hypothetical protein
MFTRKETPMPAHMLESLIDAAASVTGRRYCSLHRGEANSDAGDYIVRGKVRRWICFVCVRRIWNVDITAASDQSPQSYG